MASYKEMNDYLYKNRYSYLFIATILQIFLISFFPSTDNMLINELTFSFFMLASINLIRHSKRILFLMIFFASVSLFLVWIPDESDLGQTFLPYEKLTVMLFISVIVYQIFHQILKSKRVGADVIFGALTIYLFLGMLAGASNQLIYIFDNQSFYGSLEGMDISALRYYSFVTMTTLGYGDIAPVTQIARAVAVFYSLAGQLYLAVIVALIVGKYVANSAGPETEQKQ